jgi:hypothetical protein
MPHNERGMTIGGVHPMMSGVSSPRETINLRRSVMDHQKRKPHRISPMGFHSPVRSLLSTAGEVSNPNSDWWSVLVLCQQVYDFWVYATH